MITEKQIRAAVRQLELSGLPICVHSSFRSFGPVRGGPQAVIDSFLAEDCTLLVPTFSDQFSVPPPPELRPTRNGWDYERFSGCSSGLERIYRSECNDITMEEMGVISATVLAQGGRKRGNHPLCSFTAVGTLADELILSQSAVDVFAPLRVLPGLGGYVLLVGVGLDSMTLIHAAEEMAGRKPFIRWANDNTGCSVGVRVGGCSDGFENLRSTLSSSSILTRVGLGQWEAFPAGPTLNAAMKAIRDDPMITHCGNPDCERCRDAVAGGPTTELIGQQTGRGNE